MVGVLWMFQCIAFALVAIRLYARLVVVQTYSWDDHCFNAAVVSLFYIQFAFIYLLSRPSMNHV